MSATANTPAFNPGDIVVLKSGSPRLTILGERSPQNNYSVGWYADGKYRKELIPEPCLKLAPSVVLDKN